MDSTRHERWTQVRERLRVELGEDVFSSWFARMEQECLNGDTVKLSVPTRFLKSWVQSHYTERLLACWQAEAPEITRIEIAVRSSVLRPLPQKAKPAENGAQPLRTANEFRPTSERRSIVPPASAVHEALGGSPLDPRLTFELLSGWSVEHPRPCRRQASCASRRSDPVMFNPLYIHAGVGLGKTHLLQSIAWTGNATTERKVLYLTAERFMYGFVSALKSQNAIAFKEACGRSTSLVIDDLQFLQGRSTQAEFCHTLNALIDAGRQVVVAADRPPSDLETLEERVRSRLAGGLVVEIGSLGEELRLEIIRARVAAARLLHPGFKCPAICACVHRQDSDAQRTRP